MATKKVNKIITQEQVSKLLDTIPLCTNHQKVTYWRTIFYCGILLGLRSIETCRIHLRDIDWVEKTLTIREQKNGQLYEKIVIPEKMLEILNKHVKEYKDRIKEWGNGFIFYSKRYKSHITPEAIKYMIIKIRKESGITDVYKLSKNGKQMHVFSFHTLRHYFLTDAFDRTQDFRATQILARHKSILSTVKYQHCSIRTKRRITNKVYNQEEEIETSEIKRELSEIKKMLFMLMKDKVYNET